MERRKISIPLVEFESKVPVIKLKLGDRDLYALADSGSETTLVDIGLKGTEGIHSKRLNTEMGFVGMNGSSDKVPVTLLRGEFSVNGDVVEICGVGADLCNISAHFKDSYGSPVVISVLLGCDFLEHYDAVIDFEEHVLFLNVE